MVKYLDTANLSFKSCVLPTMLGLLYYTTRFSLECDLDLMLSSFYDMQPLVLSLLFSFDFVGNKHGFNGYRYSSHGWKF